MQLPLQFVNHIQAGMAEQDAFIADGTPGEVLRPTAQDAAKLGAPIYAAALPTEHDPFQVGPNPRGPFPKGRALGVTLEQWLAGTGSGIYTVEEDSAALHLTFRHLIPNGSYTLLAPRISLPPKFKIAPGIPGGDIARASFRADAQGSGSLDLQLQPLDESTQETLTALVLTYNSEGEWRGEDGKNAHIQIFVMLPATGGL